MQLFIAGTTVIIILTVKIDIQRITFDMCDYFLDKGWGPYTRNGGRKSSQIYRRADGWTEYQYITCISLRLQNIHTYIKTDTWQVQRSFNYASHIHMFSYMLWRFFLFLYIFKVSQYLAANVHTCTVFNVSGVIQVLSFIDRIYLWGWL